MFREGHYLEVIKASDGCLATAIVTIKEKTVEYKKKKITTNKWLDLQDWASLYSILRKAIIRNYEGKANGRADTAERRKSTSHLEVKYKFETTDSSDEQDPLPTIRVSVAPARKRAKSTNDRKAKSEKEEVKDKNERPKVDADNERTSLMQQQFNENDSFLLDNYSLEEYVPPELPSATKAGTGLDYVPSRKSMLSRMRSTTDANKYTPTTGSVLASDTSADRAEVNYVPNSIKSLTKVVHEGYDPCGDSSLSSDLSTAYVPSSKGSRSEIEEYQPDFASKTMTFDDSYVPSSVYNNANAATIATKESNKRRRKSHDSKNNKKSASSRSLISKIAKREL